jgi:hypothetical protein
LWFARLPEVIASEAEPPGKSAWGFNPLLRIVCSASVSLVRMRDWVSM